MQNAPVRPATSNLENIQPITRPQGAFLRRARLAIGYSLDDLAETTGLTVCDIENIENDVAERPDFAQRLASVLRIDVKVT